MTTGSAGESRKVRVAAIQVTSANGQAERNLENAATYVAEAAAAGARLVLCPEFLATGYVYEDSIWQAGEPRDGLTESWLRDQALEHRIHIGASFLEAEGDEFYNTFSLMAPDGEVAGRVRKLSLPFFEGWFFRPCSRPKIIETEFGRLGVGICNDNQTARFLRQMDDQRPDLVLMPHSAPHPSVPRFARAFAVEFDQQLRHVSSKLAAALGVPTIMSNKVSFATSTTGLPGLPFIRVKWQFQGLSSICDADGDVLASLEGQQGVVHAEVTLDASKKQPTTGGEGYFSFPPGRMVRASGLVLSAFELAGQISYRMSRARRRMARRTAAGRR